MLWVLLIFWVNISLIWVPKNWVFFAVFWVFWKLSPKGAHRIEFFLCDFLWKVLLQLGKLLQNSGKKKVMKYIIGLISGDVIWLLFILIIPRHNIKQHKQHTKTIGNMRCTTGNLVMFFLLWLIVEHKQGRSNLQKILMSLYCTYSQNTKLMSIGWKIDTRLY